MDELIESLERDPAFRTFLLDGQAILLEDYLRIRPEREDRVRRLVTLGRIATGPWYVLADEQIPSGESLIRNLLIGARITRFLGRRMDVLYSPDAFGHPSAWPMLAREFGIRHGVLWRGLPAARGARDLYRWTAPGGTSLLLYHLPRDGYEVGSGLAADAGSLRDAWPALREELAGRAATSQVAVFVGADHHAAHSEPTVLRALLEAMEPASAVRISSLEEYFRAVEEERPRAAELTGELRDSGSHTWSLQGVHGTRLPLKRLNSETELLLERWAEPLSALVLLRGGPDRRALLVEAWRQVVQSHFHDTICGCSADEVALEADGRLRAAAHVAREVVRATVSELAGHDPDRALANPGEPALLAWNPRAVATSAVVTADLSFFRRDVLVGPPGARLARAGKGYAPVSLVAEDGAVIPLQVIGSRRALERRDARRRYPDLDEVDAVRVAFAMPELPGLGMAHFRVRAEPSPEPPAGDVTVTGRRMTNAFVEVSIGGEGAIALTDRRSGRRYPRLCAVESEPDAGDAYSFAPGPGVPARSAVRPSVSVLASGPLTGIIESRWDALDAAWRLQLELRSGEPFVRCALGIDNRGSDRRLRARFPIGAAGAGVLAGVAFGAELRGAGADDAAGSPAETPVPTAPAHRFVGAAAGDSGVAVLLPGHAEYEWQTEGDLLLTLLRSIGQLSRDSLPTRPGHAGWPTATPLAQCHGPSGIRFAIAPVERAGLTAASLQRLWEQAFLPPGTRWFRDSGDLRATSGSIALEGEDLFVSAIKPAEEGRAIILRCWNAADRPATGRWIVTPPPRTARRVRADETGEESLTLDRGGVIPFEAPPRGLVTIKVS